MCFCFINFCIITRIILVKTVGFERQVSVWTGIAYLSGIVQFGIFVLNNVHPHGTVENMRRLEGKGCSRVRQLTGIFWNQWKGFHAQAVGSLPTLFIYFCMNFMRYIRPFCRCLRPNAISFDAYRLTKLFSLANYNAPSLVSSRRIEQDEVFLA